MTFHGPRFEFSCITGASIGEWFDLNLTGNNISFCSRIGDGQLSERCDGDSARGIRVSNL